jgi:hypothetical protein
LDIIAGTTVVSDDISIPCCELHPVKALHGFPFLLQYQVRYFGILVAMYVVVVVVSFRWYVNAEI